MNDEVNPILNHELYAQAERAAWAAYDAAPGEPPGRRIRLMEKAARAVMRKAGTPYDAAHFYAECIASDILLVAPNSGPPPASMRN